MKKASTPKSAGNARPITLSQRVDKLNRWREQYNPLAGLTLRRAVTLAQSYFRGEMTDLQWSFFFIEQTDADLLALIEMRLGRLLEMDWDIVASEEADQALAKKQIQHLREKFDAIDNLDEAIEHFGMPAFRGYAHAEKIFEAGEVVRLEIVDQWNVVRDGLRGEWKYNPDARAASFASLPEDALMPPEQFLFREVRRPINRIALFKFVRANLCEKDWDAFVEIFGFLGGVVIGPPNVQPEKAAEFETAAKSLAEGGSGYLPNGSDFKPNESAKGPHPFAERLEHLSEKLILAGTGGKLTMLAESGSGTLAGNAHADVFDQIAAGDARRVSEMFNRQLVEAWLDQAFPGQPHAAYFRIAPEDKEDVTAVIDQMVKLGQAGFEIDEAEASERTGYKLTRRPPPPATLPWQGTGDRRQAPGDPSFLTPSPAFASSTGPIRNRAAQAQAQESRGNALRLLARGLAADLAPLRLRLEAALQLPDDRIDSALAAIQADFPDLAREVLASRAGAQAHEDILGTALVEGAATAREHQSDRGASRPPSDLPATPPVSTS
ncbi:MAG: phage portal protein family protein [Opitutaceae bacterium]